MGSTRVSLTFSTRRMPMTSMTSAIGSTSQNMYRHDRKLRIRPEIVGPIAGATDMTIETRPMNRPRSDGATSVMRVVMSSGIMMAVPVACTTRASSSTSKPGASAASSVPAENRLIAVMNTGRVAMRCSRKPVIGITTAIVSMNAVVSHWRLREGDVEVDDEVRDRDAHDRLVEEDDEGGAEQQPDDAVVARAVVGLVGDDRCVERGVGRGIEDAVDGDRAIGGARWLKVGKSAFGQGIGSNRCRRTAAPGRASSSVE